MAIDPICGMTVSVDSEYRAERDGQIFYFCCPRCREQFLNPSLTQIGNPCQSQLVTIPACCHGEGNTSIDPSQIMSDYYCPMCEGVESDSPGECPICGMALEPTRAPTLDRKIIYSCTTHPAVVQNEPGECPNAGDLLSLSGRQARSWNPIPNCECSPHDSGFPPCSACRS